MSYAVIDSLLRSFGREIVVNAAVRREPRDKDNAVGWRDRDCEESAVEFPVRQITRCRAIRILEAFVQEPDVEARLADARPCRGRTCSVGMYPDPVPGEVLLR